MRENSYLEMKQKNLYDHYPPSKKSAFYISDLFKKKNHRNFETAAVAIVL
jgi:hypothetical protein